MTTQLPLPLALKPHARFATFVEGSNRELLTHLESLGSRTVPEVLWIWGAAGSGKSHLAQAVCAARPGQRVIYAPLAAVEDFGPDLLADLEDLDLIVIDDIDAVHDSSAWNRALFNLFNDTQAGRAALLLTASNPPSATPFTLPDLASRACASTIYHLHALDEADRLCALQRHAEARGLELSDAAAQYLMSRVRRDMAGLCDWLEALDHAALAAQRKLTIPLIRATLASHS
jgi:DnaA family protein